MKQLTATAFEHANVMGKKLQYLRITNGEKEVIINVGNKTYEGVKELEKEEIKEVENENNKDGQKPGNTTKENLDVLSKPNGGRK